MAELTTGSSINGYQVIRSLNSGGMGNIYLARNSTGKQVILKFPHIDIIGDPALYNRYLRELEIGRTLRHPFIQHLLDAGEYDGATVYGHGVRGGRDPARLSGQPRAAAG